MFAEHDAEDSCADAASQKLVKSELRAVRRHATASFSASLLVFAVVVCVARRVFLFGDGQGLATAPFAGSSAATNLADIGALKQAFAGMASPGTALYPVTHRTIADGVLYEAPSKASNLIGEVAMGRKVFPIKSHGDWVEVVIPRDGGSSTLSGWLIAEGREGSVLRKDPQESVRLAKFRAGPAATTQESLHEKWGRVRTSNADLKHGLVNFQETMRRRYISSVGRVEGQVGRAAINGAKHVMGGVKQDMQKLGRTIKQELHSLPKPKAIVKEVAKAFK